MPHRKPWPQYRSKHRQKSHDAAHAANHEPSPHPIFDHALVAKTEAEVVSTAEPLAELIKDLRAGRSFGYDSEFIGEHSYYPELCLIQVATPHRVALIDPLQGLDLRPFWELIADPTIEKIVHAGQPDLEPVVRHLDLPPRNAFDTQIAAAFAGLSYPLSLGKLMAALTGVELSHSTRSLKFSQWNRRPLSPAQLRYAADDVRYLPVMRRLLADRLNGLGTLEWALEECQSMSDMEIYKTDAQSQRFRVRGIEKLGRRKTAVLRALVSWRDEAARQHNVPPRALIRDEVLYALVNAQIENVSDLKSISGLPRPVQREYGETLVATMHAAAADPQSENSNRQHVRMSTEDFERHRKRIDQLWKIIHDRCAAKSIDSKIATSKKELDQVLRETNRDSAWRDSRLFRGWRAGLFALVIEEYLSSDRNAADHA